MDNFGYRTYGVTDEEASKLRGMGWEWSQRLLRFKSPTYKNVYPVTSNRQVVWASGPCWVRCRQYRTYPTALAAAVAQVIGE
jgi:hypothetical protein